MADRLHLSTKHRRVLETLLREHLPNVEVWAYGSRVNGRSHDGSDLDLVLLGPGLKEIPTGQLGDFEEAVRESTIPFLVEARDWARLPERFHREIERNFVVLVGGSDALYDRGISDVADEWRKTDYGMFPSGFSEDSLENLCNHDSGVQTGPFGSQLHKKDYVSVGTPILTVEHLGENRIKHQELPKVSDNDRKRLYKYSLRKGDIVFSRVGSVDRRALVREEEEGWLFSGRCLRVRPDPDKIDSGYLSYFFGQPMFQNYIRSIAVGATMPSLNTRILSDVVVYYPPLPEQRTIAHILGTLDDKIELNRRMNETLEAMARALYKSWFVDFDPVLTKMDGGDPGLPRHLADLFPDRLVDSELDEIPEGWEVGTLADVAFLNPESWSTKHHPEELAYVDLANTKWGYIDHVETFTWYDAPSRARRVLRKGDTIMATVRPDNGSYTLINEDGLTASTGFAVLRPRKEFDRELIWIAATYAANIERLAHLADGGAYPAVRPDVVATTPVILPGPEVRREFSVLCRPLIDKIEINKREAKTVSTLRDSLLPKLISSEILTLNTKNAISIQTK